MVFYEYSCFRVGIVFLGGKINWGVVGGYVGGIIIFGVQ